MTRVDKEMLRLIDEYDRYMPAETKWKEYTRIVYVCGPMYIEKTAFGYKWGLGTCNNKADTLIEAMTAAEKAFKNRYGYELRDHEGV